MTNIFIDTPILLEHWFQVAKGVFLGYHLPIESNIPLLLCGSTEITLHVLYFRPIKIKTFSSKVRLHNSHFWLAPILLDLIYQDHIIYKEHTPSDATLYVSCDLIHHQSKELRA
jgi:hypothetical protein